MSFVAYQISVSCGQCAKLHKTTTYMCSAQIAVKSLNMPITKILTGLDGRKAKQQTKVIQACSLEETMDKDELQGRCPL